MPLIDLTVLRKAIAAAEKDIHFFDPPDAKLCQALIDAGKAYVAQQEQPE